MEQTEYIVVRTWRQRPQPWLVTEAETGIMVVPDHRDLQSVQDFALSLQGHYPEYCYQAVPITVLS